MTLFVGMGPGYAIVATVDASSEFDPAAVSAPVLVVVDPRGRRYEWAGTITAQSSASVTTSTPFPEEQPHIHGQWRAYVRFTAGLVTKRSTPFSFDVEREI